MFMRSTVCIEEGLYKRSQAVWDLELTLDFAAFPRGDWESAMNLHNKTGSRIFITGTSPVYERFLQRLSHPCLIQRYGVGYGNIPLPLCRDHGHSVGYTPGALDVAVAEQAMALILACARRVVTLNQVVRSGNWTQHTGFELRGKALGIIGFGKIGQRLAAIAKHGFGMRIIAHGIHSTLNREALKLVDHYTTDLLEAVSASDVLSLHLPEVDATRDCINSRILSNCKQGAILVNTSRGSVLNEDDLFEALQTSHIAAAALDVFKNEPYKPSGKRDLRQLDNLIMVPHCASNTLEANQRMAEICIRNAVAYLEGNHMGMESFVIH